MHAVRPGMVLTTTWLNEHGYYRQLVRQYCLQDWLRRVGPAAYVLGSDKPSWVGAVAALQQQLHYPIHIGGLSALALHGVMQYVPLSNKGAVVSLFPTKRLTRQLPAWFGAVLDNEFHNKTLCRDATGVEDLDVEGMTLRVSDPERAILEVLSLVPKKITLEHADELMESLNHLRPSYTQQALESCMEIKTKRLFLYLAEKHELAFFNRIILGKFVLGKGKCVLGSGGVYSKKWRLSLPKVHNDEGDDEIY